MRNLKGQSFNRWTVIEFSHVTKNYEYYWKCKCDCGNEKFVRDYYLISNKSRSCGCIRLEILTKHGDYKTRLYKIWNDIIQRCNNSNNCGYKNYGGRGIKVCDKWLNYNNFKIWSLNNGYQENLEIDRKDNHDGYNPHNCRFVTSQQNNFNKKSSKNSSSKYKGVSYHKLSSKWRATIGYNRKHIHLGCFLTEEEAALAYNEKASELFGEYAHLNNIKGK